MADWYDTNWSNRFKVTSDNTKVAAAIKGLAIDLSLAPTEFWSNVKSDGGDIRVTQSDGTTEVARDVISIDTTGEKGLLRIDSGAISTSADTDYYVYYGNASADEPATGSTYGQYNAYDSQIDMALESLGNTFNDRTGQRSITDTEGTLTEVSSSLGKATEIEHPGGQQINPVIASPFPYTSYALIQVPSTLNDLHPVFADGVTETTDYAGMSYRVMSDTHNRKVFLRHGDGGCAGSGRRDFLTSTQFPPNRWALVAVRVNSLTDVDILFEGVTQNLEIDAGGSSSSMGYGDLSGVGISQVSSCQFDYRGNTLTSFVHHVGRALSNNELLTISNNSADNDTFWSFGEQEEVITLTITTQAATNISYNEATLNGEVSDLE